MLSRLHGRLPPPFRHLSPIIVVGVLLSVVAAGSATAAKLITGGDIKNGSLTAADVRNGSMTGAEVKNGSLTGADVKNGSIDTSSLAVDAVTRANLAPGVLATIDRVETGPRGETGSKGEAGTSGSAGARGAQGPIGAPGQALVTSVLTAPNATYAGANVVDVPSALLTDTGPTAFTGVEIMPPVALAEGRYLVQATAQFFDFNKDGDGVAYGVTKTFLDGVVVPTGGTSWTSDIPDNDSNNAAQNSGAIVVNVPAGGASLSVRALVRGGLNTFQAGVSGIITTLG